MPGELNYKIQFASDVSGINNATAGLGKMETASAGAFDSIAARGSAAQMAFVGIEQAAKGNMFAIMGVARAFRALWMAISAGNPIIALAVIIGTVLMKVFEHFTEKYNEASKASLEAAEKTARFTDSLKELLAKQREVSFSLEEHVKWLEKISSYYEDAIGASDQYAESQKRLAAAQRELAVARVNVKETSRLLGAAGDPVASAQAQLTAGRERAAIETESKLRDLAFDRQKIENQIALSRRNVKDLGKELAPSVEIAGAGQQIADLKNRQAAARQNPKEYLRLYDEIKTREKELADMRAKEAERIDAVNAKREAANSRINDLTAELSNNDALVKAIKLQADTEENKALLQARINRAKEQELALQKQEADISAKADQQKIADQISINFLKKDEKAAIAEATRTAKIRDDPTFRRAQQKEVNDRNRAIAEGDRIARRLGVRIPVSAEDTAADIRGKLAIAQAQDQKRRGIRGGNIEEILAAGRAGNAAKAATLAREAAELKMQQDIASSASALQEIKKTLASNLKAAA